MQHWYLGLCGPALVYKRTGTDRKYNETERYIFIVQSHMKSTETVRRIFNHLQP